MHPTTPSFDSPSFDTGERLAALFPDPEQTEARRTARRVRRAFAGVTVLVLLSGGVAVAQASGAEALKYRTATVGDHDVQSLLTSVGTVEAVTQAAVAFPVSGTVSAVNVMVGDTVTVGQTLAMLDATSLTETLHTKQAALAQAELVLANALNGESTSGSGSSAGSRSSTKAVAATTTTTAPAAAAPVASASSSNNAAIQDAQQAVLAAQQAVDAALTQATQALADADSVCAAVDATTDTASCRTALAAVLAAQTSASTAQQQLATASTTLDGLLATSAAGTTSTSASTSSTSTPSASTASTSTASTITESTVSSEELIADQKAVDAAGVDVIVATQALAQNSLVSPIAGTVIGVSLAVGESVTAGSSTATITIVGDGGYEVTTNVSVDEVTDLAVGQAASVLIDGSAEELEGEIVSIGVAPTSSSSTTSYQVVIGLTDPEVDLENGATGTVSIVTKATSAAPSVPTSAITTDGTRHTVTVLSDTTTKTVTVDVGVVGSTWTEITKGVTGGQQVVVASLDEALPGSATSTSSSSSTGNNTGGTNGQAGPGGPPTGAGGFPAPPN